jgi:hypothetical protein
MNSPPKKCILNQPKWGGGIPISNNNALTSHPPTVTPLTKTRFIPLPTTEALDNRFDMIRAEMQSQCEINVHLTPELGHSRQPQNKLTQKLIGSLATWNLLSYPTRFNRLHQLHSKITTVPQMNKNSLSVSPFVNRQKYLSTYLIHKNKIKNKKKDNT